MLESIPHLGHHRVEDGPNDSGRARRDTSGNLGDREPLATARSEPRGRSRPLVADA